MSCYMCCPEQLSTLAAYAVRNQIATPDARLKSKANPTEYLAKVLYEANADAVRTTYPSKERLNPFRFDALGDARAMLATPVQILKSAKVYSYQACASPTWNRCLAREVIEAIIDHAIRRLPGYEEA